MIHTLENMSGKTHKAVIDQKNVTRDISKMWFNNEGKITYTMQAKEVPVISFNDMSFIPKSNSIVFRAGDPPIWNRNETVLPMSWRLFKDTIEVPGREFTLQTIPTMSSVLDFDLKRNQPDFDELLAERMAQAMLSDAVRTDYKESLGCSDADLARMDLDVLADDLMRIMREGQKRAEAAGTASPPERMETKRNDEQIEATRQQMAKQATRDKKRFAGGQLSRDDLRASRTQTIETAVTRAYASCYQFFDKRDRENLVGDGHGNLRTKDGTVLARYTPERLEQMKEMAKDPKSNTFVDIDFDALSPEERRSFLFSVEAPFYSYFARFRDWSAFPEFDKAVTRELALLAGEEEPDADGYEDGEGA